MSSRKTPTNPPPSQHPRVPLDVLEDDDDHPPLLVLHDNRVESVLRLDRVPHDPEDLARGVEPVEPREHLHERRLQDHPVRDPLDEPLPEPQGADRALPDREELLVLRHHVPELDALRVHAPLPHEPVPARTVREGPHGPLERPPRPLRFPARFAPARKCHIAITGDNRRPYDSKGRAAFQRYFLSRRPRPSVFPAPVPDV